MADWTNLPNQAVGVGGLPSGTTVTALRDNPIAIAQGADGAPRLYGKAAVPRSQQTELEVLSLTASDDVILGDLHYSGDFSSTTTTSTTFQSAGIITSVLLSGTVRFRASQSAGSPSIGDTTCQIRILKNGIEVESWSITSPTPAATRIIDLSVAVGDTFEWQVRRSGGGVANCTISSINERANDGYTRIAIPIKVSDL